MVCAERGYACFQGAARTSSPEYVDALTPLADRLRYDGDGAYIGLARFRGRGRTLASCKATAGRFTNDILDRRAVKLGVGRAAEQSPCAIGARRSHAA
jgi:hypothetical protein